jgi:hypothetical protein
MIGQALKRKDDKSVWKVVAYDEAQGQFVLSPEVFGPSVALASEDIRAQFSNVRAAKAPDATDEVSAWKRFGESFERVAPRRSTINGSLTVEDVFAGRALAKAQEIAGNADALADYAIGVLPVSPAVAEHLEAILAEGEAAADRETSRAADLTASDARRLGHQG